MSVIHFGVDPVSGVKHDPRHVSGNDSSYSRPFAGLDTCDIAALVLKRNDAVTPRPQDFFSIRACLTSGDRLILEPQYLPNILKEVLQNDDFALVSSSNAEKPWYVVNGAAIELADRNANTLFLKLAGSHQLEFRANITDKTYDQNRIFLKDQKSYYPASSVVQRAQLFSSENICGIRQNVCSALNSEHAAFLKLAFTAASLRYANRPVSISP